MALVLLLLVRPLLLLLLRHRRTDTLMIAPEELADLRSLSNDALEGLCDVVRLVRTRQPNNSWKDVEQTVYSGVPCRKVPTGQTPLELATLSGQQQTDRTIAVFLMPFGTAIYTDDIVVRLPDGKHYPIAGVADRDGSMYVRVYVYDDSKAP